MTSLSDDKDVAEPKRPLATFTSWWGGLFSRKHPDSSLKEALEEAIERSNEDEEITDDERVILRNMLSVGDLTVHNIMVPRSTIVAVEYGITLTELKQMIIEKQHTRMPVYLEELDTLKGFIHLKDLVPVLAGDEPFDMDNLVRDIMFIAPSMKLIDLLVKMRLTGSHMAIIVDEYGGTDGLVTLEDIFEALVGEIQDEHDLEDSELHFASLRPNRFMVDARMRIEDIKAKIKVDLREYCDDADYDTLGGFIFGLLHRIPLTGELIDVEGLGQLRIIEADPRRIRRVQMNLNFSPIIATAPPANAS
jgi:magnesium and cobalt transporter